MRNDTPRSVPPRIQVALDFLTHTRWVTQQEDASVPARSLTPLEKAVESAALRTLQSYLLGEMDFGDVPPVAAQEPPPDDPPSAGVPVPQPQ
jgi:hypothetical protein